MYCICIILNFQRVVDLYCIYIAFVLNFQRGEELYGICIAFVLNFHRGVDLYCICMVIVEFPMRGRITLYLCCICVDFSTREGCMAFVRHLHCFFNPGGFVLYLYCIYRILNALRICMALHFVFVSSFRRDSDLCSICNVFDFQREEDLYCICVVFVLNLQRGDVV